jgi:hypothetical protein
MTNMAGLSKTEQLRARDGDGCWLCGGKLDFEAAPNSKKAPTLEHLQPSSKGGSNKLDNLVLCHPGCNKQLGDRPKADKLRIREKRLVARPAKLSATPLAKAPTPVTPVQSRNMTTLQVARRQHGPSTDIWRTRALIAGAVAMSATGLSLGLILGRSRP